ncbi:MAG: glutathione S-transferase family protein [Pseudomonadota bacterium]
MTIRVHHLRVGRSVFTVWLLEELGLDYELEIYDRNEMGRAPDTLKAAHPLGKSPVLEIDGVTMAESTAIGLHLVETRGVDSPLAPPTESTARAKWLQLLLYPEGSAFVPMLMKLLLSREAEPKPMLISMFAEAEVQLHLNFMRDQLAAQDYILGDALTLPDIGWGYIAHMADRLELLGDSPTLKAYTERCTARPAFQRAMERTGG